MAAKSALDEYIIRVPQVPTERRFSVLKFNGNLGVDVSAWNAVSMERENNAAVFADDARGPDTGAGSEFGRKAREEARRRKLGRQKKEYKLSDQPWMLTVHGKQEKKYRGVREGGVNDHADYWVFVKSADGVFDAVPVSEWYNFLPVARYKTLDAEEAEDKFQKRNQILNQFALMKKPSDEEETEKGRKKTLEDDEDLGIAKRKGSDDDTDDFKLEKAKKQPGKGGKKRGTSKAKKSRQKGEGGSGDEIASGDSDDGDEEGREVDYMSDEESSSSSDAEETTKVQKALIGVADEEGLKALLSDNEEEEEAENPDKDVITTDLLPGENDDSSNESEFIDAPPRPKKAQDDDSSDSEDPDKEEIKPSLFKSLDEPSGDATASTKGAKQLVTSASTPSLSQLAADKKGLKRKEILSTESLAKKAKIEGDKSSPAQGITEEEVKRYLQRKPHSTKDLVAKFKGRTGSMSKVEIVQNLAQILKKLNPEQYKKNDVLYFSMGTD